MQQKICWLLHQKVANAIKSSKNRPKRGKLDVDETFVGGEDTKAKGRNKGNKKTVVVAIKKKGKG